MTTTEIPELAHGTYNGYKNYGCRCVRCKEANRLYAADYRARKAAGKLRQPGRPEPWPADKITRLLTLHEYGMTPTQIAADMREGVGTIRYRLKKHLKDHA